MCCVSVREASPPASSEIYRYPPCHSTSTQTTQHTQHSTLHHVLDARPLTPSPLQSRTSNHTGSPSEAATMGSKRRSSRPGGHDGGDAGRDEDEGYQPELLDEDEQATLIAELRRKGEEQSRSTRVREGVGMGGRRGEGRLWWAATREGEERRHASTLTICTVGCYKSAWAQSQSLESFFVRYTSIRRSRHICIPSLPTSLPPPRASACPTHSFPPSLPFSSTPIT